MGHLIYNLFTRYDLSDDYSRRRFMFVTLLSFGLFFLTLLGIFAYIEKEYSLALADLIVIIIVCFFLFSMDRLMSLDTAMTLIIYFFSLFLFYLFYSGNARNQSFVWKRALKDFRKKQTGTD